MKQPASRPRKAKAPRRRRSLVRRIARGFGLALLGIVVVLLATVGYLHTEAGKARVLGIVRAKLGERVNGTVELASLDYALFGQIRLAGLRIRDEAGVEAVALDELALSPAWGELLRLRAISFDEVSLRGLRLTIVKDAVGGSNLKGLFKASPAPAEPRKPLSKPIDVRALTIEGVAVSVQSPDGTTIALRGLRANGAVHLLPSAKDYTVRLEPIELALAVHKPTETGAIELGLEELRTALAIRLEGGQGSLALLPLEATVALKAPPNVDRRFPFRWQGITLALAEGELGATLEKLVLGAVTLASLEVKGHRGAEGLEGLPIGAIVGLHVSAREVNALLGRELLGSDLELEATLGDEERQAALGLELEAGGGTILLRAKVDPNAAPAPGVAESTITHDVTLSLRALDTERLLAPAAQVTPVRVGSLDLHAKGVGRSAASLDTSLELEASAIRARGVPIDSIRARGKIAGGRLELESLELTALEQRVRAHGRLGGPDKEIDLSLAIDGDVGVALGHLRAAGLPIRTALPPSVVRLPADDLRVAVKGQLGSALEVTAKADRLALFGGTGRLDTRVALRMGDPARGEKKVEVTEQESLLDVQGVRLSSLLALRGKSLPPGFDVRAGLRVKARGTPAAPELQLRAGLETLREDGGPRLGVAVDGRLAGGTARIDVDAHGIGAAPDPVLALRTALPVALAGERKGLDLHRPMELDLELPKRSLASLAQFVPSELLRGRTIPRGELGVTAHLEGTAVRPRGEAHVELAAALLSTEPDAPRQQLKLDATLAPAGPSDAGSDARVALGVRLDENAAELLTGELTASLPRSPLLGGAKEPRYQAHFELPRTALSSLPTLPKLAKVRALGGQASAKLDLQGDRSDLGAALSFEAAGLRPGGKGPIDASLKAVLGAQDATIDLGVDLAGQPLAVLAGSIGVAGKGLLARVREGLDPVLDLTLTVPERSLATLAALAPKLAKAPGKLAGRLHVGGRATHPLVDSAFALDRVRMLDGTDGGGRLALRFDEQALAADVALGSTAGADAPAALAVRAPRDAVEAFLQGEPLRVDATARAAQVDVRRLVPAQVVGELAIEPDAKLDWDMKAFVELERRDGRVRLAGGEAQGTLSLAGRVPLPGTRRVWDDITLRLRAEPRGLRLETLRLHEGDEDEPKRTLAVEGRVGLEALRPTSAELSIEGHRWLLFGAGPLGRADAPRGTLTIAARVNAELDRPMRAVSVDVRKLELVVPDRYEKAHQPEDVHLGDVIKLGSGVELGKLPVPESVRAKAEAKAALALGPPAGDAATVSDEAVADPSNAGEAANATALGGAEPERGLDLRIHVAPGSRLFQSPLDLVTGGDIHVRSTPAGRRVEGKLTMTGGELSLGGQMHPLRRGTLVIDPEHPKGWIDLWFEKPMPPWALRDVSEASAGRAIVIHMFGPPTDRKTVLGGAGSPGTLLDLLAMHNEGRPMLVTGPDLPESVTVDFPQESGLLVLSFMAVNLPHLLFLDRVVAWSDPYDGTKSYGQVEHFEGEAYFADGQGRVRAAKQPAGVGRSEAELEVDYLFVNDPRLLFGIGVTAGSRAGGGPGLVFEWSSEE